MNDDSDKDKRKQSLLSLGAPVEDAPRGGSLLSAALRAEGDSAERHRAARSKREAPSPLLEALAAMEGFTAKPADAGGGEAGVQPPVAQSRSRWSLRNLLSPKVKHEPPQPKPAWQPPQAAATPPHQPETAATPDELTAGGEPVDDHEIRTEAELPLAERSEWRPLIDPLQVIGGVSRSVPLIVAMTLLGAAIGVAMALSTPKKYEAVSKLLIDPRDLKVSDRDLTQSGLPSDATLALIENQVDIITSNAVLEKVVTSEKLDEDPEFNGQGGGVGIGDIIGGLRSLLSSGQSGGDRRRALAVATLAESLTVERTGKKFIVTVSVKADDPDKAVRIVDAVDKAYLEQQGVLQKEMVGRAEGELSGRLKELQADLEKSERAAEQFRAEHDLIDAQGRLISDDELVKLNDQLATLRAQKIEINARAASARAVKVDSVIGGGLPEELTSPVMSELRSQYGAIKQQADQLSVRVGPRHPQYLAMQAQLEGARAQISGELQRIVATVQTELRRAVQQEQDLAARLAQLKVRATDVNSDLVTMRQLERETAAKRSVYENYLLRAKDAGGQSGINTANVMVISPPVAPLQSTGASRAVIAAAGALLGFLAGIGIGMARGIFASLRERARPSRRRGPAVMPAATALLEETPGVEEEREPPAAEVRPTAETLRQARVEAARRAVEAVTAGTGPAATPAGPASTVAHKASVSSFAAAEPPMEAPPVERRSAEGDEPRVVASTDRAEWPREETAAPRQAAEEAGEAPASQEEAAMNPLVRLMRRMRLPAVVVGDGRDAGSASHSTDTTPATPAKKEQEAMYPYPQQHPYAAPQPAMAHPQQPAHPYPVQAYPQPVQPYAQAAWPQPAPYAPPAPPHFQPQQSLPPYPPAFMAAPAYAAPPQPAGYPYPQPPHGWQPVGPYGYPQPAAPFAYPGAPQPAAYPQAYAGPVQSEQRAESREMSPIEEVRESLREFREAILDLAADRARRRYS